MLKKIALVLLTVLVIIQFIHPAKNKSEGVQANNIAALYPVPADVKTVLDKACMDCHSNNTRYPWYSKIQPVDWWLTDHVNEGKRELNFDEYANKPVRYRYRKIEEAIEQVKKGEMPLNSYTWIHKDAILSDTEKNAFYAWCEGILSDIKAKYPADSLLRPKRN
jgi:hypothetical protein